MKKFSTLFWFYYNVITKRKIFQISMAFSEYMNVKSLTKSYTSVRLDWGNLNKAAVNSFLLPTHHTIAAQFMCVEATQIAGSTLLGRQKLGAIAPPDFVGKIFRTCSTKRPSITAWPQKDFQTFLRLCDGSLAISCRPRRSSNAVETFFKPHIIFCTLSKISQIIFGLKNEKMSREIVKGDKAIPVLNPLVYLVTIHAIWKKNCLPFHQACTFYESQQNIQAVLKMR